MSRLHMVSRDRVAFKLHREAYINGPADKQYPKDPEAMFQDSERAMRQGLEWRDKDRGKLGLTACDCTLLFSSHDNQTTLQKILSSG